MSNLVEIHNLRVKFNTDSGEVNAVNGISFNIKKGETLALVGESGSGKSVTARGIIRLLASNAVLAEETKITFDGKNINTYSEKEYQKIRGNKISMIFQEPMSSLNPIYTIENQISEVLKIHDKYSDKELKNKCLELLKQVQMPEPESRLSQYPHQLSGGQRQRIMIAIAIANNPDLLIADEPTTALDVTIQAQILDLMIKLKNEIGMSILFITHDLGLIQKFSDTITVMQDGEIVEQGDTKTVFSNPQHAYTKKLIDSEPEAKKETLSEKNSFMDVKDLNIFYPLPNRNFFKKEFFHAVKDVNFSIPRQSTIGLVGESGSGKSTLGKALAGLIDFKGSVLFDDLSLESILSSSPERFIGYLPQDVLMNPGSVAENIAGLRNPESEQVVKVAKNSCKTIEHYL